MPRNQKPDEEMNEELSEDTRAICYSAYYSTVSGEVASLNHEDAVGLQKLGLIKLDEKLSGESPAGSEFSFTMTSEGESVAKAYRQRPEGPTDDQLSLSAAGHEASEARYRRNMKEEGRGRLLS